MKEKCDITILVQKKQALINYWVSRGLEKRIKPDNWSKRYIIYEYAVLVKREISYKEYYDDFLKKLGVTVGS